MIGPFADDSAPNSPSRHRYLEKRVCYGHVPVKPSKVAGGRGVDRWRMWRLPRYAPPSFLFIAPFRARFRPRHC
jgi:hypothetical protein